MEDVVVCYAHWCSEQENIQTSKERL